MLNRETIVPLKHPLAADCARVTGRPEVIGSFAGFVPIDALVLTGLATVRVVSNPETYPPRFFLTNDVAI